MTHMDRRRFLLGAGALTTIAAFDVAGGVSAQAANPLAPGITKGKFPNLEKLIAYLAPHADVFCFADDGHDDLNIKSPFRDLDVMRALRRADAIDGHIELSKPEFGIPADLLALNESNRQRFTGYMLEERLSLIRKLKQEQVKGVRDDLYSVRQIEAYADIIITGRMEGVRVHASDVMPLEQAARVGIAIDALKINDIQDIQALADLYENQRLAYDHDVAETIIQTTRKKAWVLFGGAHLMFQAKSSFFMPPRHNIDDVLRDKNLRTVIIHVSNTNGSGMGKLFNIFSQSKQLWRNLVDIEQPAFGYSPDTDKVLQIAWNQPSPFQIMQTPAPHP